jgi:uncharacterized protein YcbX
MATISSLYRYPVKGLSPEPLDAVALVAGGSFPFDRAYAIENGPSGFDPAEPRALPKAHFLMLMRNERLASLRTRFDEATTTLSIRRDGTALVEARLDTADGRRSIEDFFGGFAAPDLRGPARIVSAPGHTFADAGEKLVSLINLASVREIEAVVGVPVSPLRFRGNLYVEGLAPWAEFAWVGGRVDAGSVRLEAVERISRCAATNVNPDTAARDLMIPRTLLETYGHADCGIYMRVATGGVIKVGDRVGPD